MNSPFTNSVYCRVLRRLFGFALLGVALWGIGSGSVDPRVASAAPPALNNNRVLEDADFSAPMAEADIQAFLTAHGSFFANYTDPDGHGTAAQVFADRAREWGISPRVLLVTAEKESSSISTYQALDEAQYDSYGRDSVAGTSYGKRVDWFLFCGWTEQGVYTGYKGFYNQVDCAAETLSKPFRKGKAWLNSMEKHVGDTAIIDGQRVTVETLATLALYSYTPHIQTSFFTIWTQFLPDVNFQPRATQPGSDGRSLLGKYDVSVDRSESGRPAAAAKSTSTPRASSADSAPSSPRASGARTRPTGHSRD